MTKKEVQSVRCIDCAHGGKLVSSEDLVCRCKVFGVGKVARARRRCDRYEEKQPK